MGDRVLTTTNTTSNRSKEPDQSGSYVLAMSALQGGFPWAVSTSVYLAPRVHNIGVLVGYRNWGVKSSAGFKSADSFLN